MLQSNTIDLDLETFNQGYTPLIISCFQGYYEISNLLLEVGAEVNKPSKLNLTPLSTCFSRLEDDE